MSNAQNGHVEQAISWRQPDEALDRWQFDPAAPEGDPIDLLQEILTESVQLHHPHYMGHQISPPAPVAALAGFLGDFLNAGMGMSYQVENLIADASAIAIEKNIYIVLPTFDFGKTPAENKVHIIDPNGDIVLTHVKYGGNDFEGSLKGDGVLQTVDTPYGKLSAIICWDADFANAVKQAGEQNVDLLFVPSNDWLEVKDIHAGMAAFRAVENGTSVFRQTGEGVSSVVDAYGREVNRVDMFEENASGFTGIQNVQTPIGSVNTLYPSVGDGVGSVMLLGLVGLLIGLWVTRTRR